MISGMAAAGALGVLLDLIPVCGGILLLVSFARRRSSMKAEEKKLKDTINAFAKERRNE